MIIMKNLLFLMLFSLGLFVIANAQPVPPVPPSSPGISEQHATSSSRVEINMKLDGNQKLKLNSTDDRFSMLLDYKSEDHAALRELLIEYLGQPSFFKENYDQWIGDKKQFKYLLKKGKLKVTIDKNLLNAKEEEELYQLTLDTFSTIAWEVDLQQL